MGNRSYPGTVLGDVVDAAAWGSKNYMLRGVGWLQADVYAACSGGVVVVVLGDLVTWRHFVRGLEGATQPFISKLSVLSV